MSAELEAILLPPIAPPPLSWWPPALGWWLLALTLILLLLSLPWALRALGNYRQRRQLLQDALQQIPEQMPDAQWLAALNTLIKRHVKQRGNEAATRLYGQQWLDYLCHSYPKPQRQALEPLATALYQPAAQLSSVQRQALRREVLRWIRHNHA